MEALAEDQGTQRLRLDWINQFVRMSATCNRRPVTPCSSFSLDSMHGVVVKEAHPTGLTLIVTEFFDCESVLKSAGLNHMDHSNFTAFGAWERFNHRCFFCRI